MTKSRTAQIDLGDDDPPYLPKPLAQVIAWDEVRPFREPGRGFKYEHGPKWLKCRGEAGCVAYVIKPVGVSKKSRGYRLGWYDYRKADITPLDPVLIRRSPVNILFDSIEDAKTAAQVHLDGLHAKAAKPSGPEGHVMGANNLGDHR
jgi:hypothetical protein